MGNVIRGPWRHGRSSKTRKSSAVTAPAVMRAMRSATSRDGQPLPSQSMVIHPLDTPMDDANSPRLMLCSSKYSDSFMIDAFSSAKNSAQGEILAGLHRQTDESYQQFSMSKNGTLKRKLAEPTTVPLQRTFLKQWRLHRDLSQTELGDAVGLSTATISQIENAKTGYSQATLEAIARALKVHPVDLLVCDPTEHPKGIWQTLAAILA